MRAFACVSLGLGVRRPAAARATQARSNSRCRQAREAAIIDQTNAYRADEGLAASARECEREPRRRKPTPTTSPETARQGHSADGRSPFQRLRASGTKFCKFRGENWHESWTRPARVVAGGRGRGSHALLEAFAGA